MGVRPAKPVQMTDEVVDEFGADLHLADPRLGLGVGDVEASAGRVMEAQWRMRMSHSSLTRTPL